MKSENILENQITPILSKRNQTIDYFRGMIFMLSLFPIGIALFVYTVTGVSLVAGMSITIIGLPLAFVFLASIPYIIQALQYYTEFITGTPVKKMEINQNEGMNFFEKLFAMVTDKSTLFFLGFSLVFALPIAIFSFVSFVTALSIGVSFMALVSYPFVNMILRANGFDTTAILSFGSGIEFIMPVWFEWIVALAFPIMGYYILKFTFKLADALTHNMAEYLSKFSMNF
ncbi:MAG: sensor domain-containing protein [Candidatus Heimdallarchaeota archaeon]|nr:sensor domain-containing protein [Candidatus Heimdallarchaeota archaeon]